MTSLPPGAHGQKGHDEVIVDPDFAGVDSTTPLSGPQSVSAVSSSYLRPRQRTPRRHRTISASQVFDQIDQYARRSIPTRSRKTSTSSATERTPLLTSEGGHHHHHHHYGENADESIEEIQEEQEHDAEIEDQGQGKERGRERDGVKLISNFETITHILKGNIGIGVLTLPVAIKNSGLIFGNISLAIIAFICVHCMKILVKSAHKACDKRPDCEYLDYADTAEASFIDAGGNWAKWSTFMRRLINVFLTLSQWGSNAVYVLFIAQNIQPIFIEYGGEFFKDLNYRVYIAFILLPMILVCSIRNLKYLSPFSIFATLIQIVGLSIIFYYIFATPLPPSSWVPWVADSSRLPLFFGTAIFAIEGISVVLPIENQMRRPRDMMGWTGVLSTSMTVVTALYVAVGFYGYLKYGEDVEASITLNLPSEDILAQIVLLTFSVAIFFSYALQFYVLMEIIGPNVLRPNVPSRWYSITDYAARAIINILTFALAATVPWLDLLVSLLGAIKMSTLALMAPAIIDMATHWNEPNATKRKWRIAKNILVFIFGFFGCVMGTYVSIVNIVANFRKSGA